MSIQLATTLRSNIMDQITAFAGQAAYLRIFSGEKPSTPAAELSGNTQLAEFICGSTFSPAAVNGVLTLNTIANESSADATGTATFFRIYTSEGSTCVMQGNVDKSGSDLNLDNTDIVATALITIPAFTLTAPGA